MSGWTQPPESSGASPAADEAWLCRDLPPATSGAGLIPTREVEPEEARLLLRTVETEIIPRLMLLHRRSAHRAKPATPALRIGERDVIALTELVLSGHQPAAEFVVTLLRRGASLESIYLELLAATARRLGELWCADRCTFSDVTIALGRLQRIVFELVEGERLPHSDGGSGHRAMLVPAPGEQHTFGLTLVCEFFRSSGWEVWSDSTTAHEALIELVRDHWFDIVGFSIGNERRIDSLSETIRAIRKISRNRAVRVLVGGPLMIQRPELAARLGADATALDARQAMLAAERLVATRDGR